MCPPPFPPQPAAPAWPAAPPAPARSKATIYAPVLVVPPLPDAPAPVVDDEPESDAIVTLRSLLADRRNERDRVDEMRRTHEVRADQYEEAARTERTRVAEHAHHVSVADAAISDLLDAIAKLGGKPEPVEA